MDRLFKLVIEIQEQRGFTADSLIKDNRMKYILT